MVRTCKFVGSLSLLAALAAFGAAFTATAQDKNVQKSKIDLVICIDTSSSMNGLIESAKVKIWDIVNELAKAKPAPDLRIALYAYGSPQYGQESGWVRKELGFSTDLDAVYEKLFALRTSGGNEYVARVCQAALDQLDWAKEKDALRMIFVCGNEPATQDPLIKIEDVASTAVKRDIYINTIHCQRGGNGGPEAAGWQKLASLAEGRFVTIDQNRAAVAVSTPVDGKIATLGAELNKTYVWYGVNGEQRKKNQLAQDGNAKQLGAGVEAARAASKGNGLYRIADADLVDRCLTEANFDINKIAEKDLPENLQKMQPAERVKHVQEMTAKRLTLQKEIDVLNKQRQEHITQQLKAQQGGAERAFDEAIRGVLQIQAEKKNIQFAK